MSALSEEQFAIAALRTKLREAEAENARLVKERDAAIKTCEMASTSGAFWARRAEAAEARAAELERKVGEMREALKPFAEEASAWGGFDDDESLESEHGLTVGLLRRAAALCEPEGGA